MWQSVEYAAFWVGPKSDKYRLSVFGFTGDTGDALAAPVHVARISKECSFPVWIRITITVPFIVLLSHSLDGG